MQRVILISLAIVMLFALNCAAQQYAPKENEEIYGRWENEDYKADDTWYEIGYEAVGKCDLYKRVMGMPFVNVANYVVASKSTDSDGNVWYKQTWSLTGTYDWDIKGKKFVLAKVSSDRQTLEIAINDSDFPTEIDPNYSGYLIYSRKE